MPPIRVVLAGLPPVLDTYFCNLFHERDDIEGVKSYSNCDDMLSDIDSTKPDIALICLDEKKVSFQCLEDVRKYSGIKIIAIDDKARNAFLFLGEASADTVIDSIRALAERKLH